MFLPIPNPNHSSKSIFFDLPNIEQFRTNILQIHHFQYQFLQNFTLNSSTKEQIQIYSLFLKKFFRHNYQLIWQLKISISLRQFPTTIC